jgi:predicted nucleic acid-binding protein
VLGGGRKVQHKRLVIDANILIRAVLGVRVRQLIAAGCANVAIYAAEEQFEEASRYLAHLAPRKGIPQDTWEPALETLRLGIQVIGTAELEVMRDEAVLRIGTRDPKDWPALAAALLLNCPIWTEDRDFFGTGVPTWITSNVHRYLEIAPA